MSLFHRMEEVFGSKKGGLANLNFLFIHMQTEENESKVFSDRFIGVILLIWNTLCFVRIYEGTSRVWPYRVCGILYGIVMPMVVISGNSNIWTYFIRCGHKHIHFTHFPFACVLLAGRAGRQTNQHLTASKVNKVISPRVCVWFPLLMGDVNFSCQVGGCYLPFNSFFFHLGVVTFKGMFFIGK